MREMNQSGPSEDSLSSALRELATGSSQAPPAQLGITLKDAFRRHHIRRRRALRTRVTLFSLGIALLAGSLLFRSSAVKVNTAQKTTVHTIPPQEFTSPDVISISRQRQPVGATRAARKTPAANTTNAFVALPSFDMPPLADDLRVVRLELTGEELRLVGAPVTEELVGRRVTADFVVGHDGTPYAVRLVQPRF